MTPALRIALDIPNHPTSLLVQRGALRQLGRVLGEESIAVSGRRVLVVVDGNIASSHGVVAREALSASGAFVAAVELNASETAKSVEALGLVWQAALAHRLDRGGLIVALGGGLVGDVAGFAAASFMRGIDLVQVPTTLLSMVDASIGGKTGINLPLPGGGLGKNLAGAFWQPRLTVADADTLATLPLRQLRAGLAECVKHAVIAGDEAFAQLERDAALLRDGDAAAIDALIPRSAAVKAAIVERDPLERGERALLNLGHTFGHAIETIPSLELLHGEAVAIGLVAAAQCAAAAVKTAVAAAGTAVSTADDRGGTAGDRGGALVERLERLLTALALPTRLPAPIASAEIERRMGYDKKNESGALKLVLPRALGEVVVTTGVDRGAIASALARIGGV